MFSISMLAPEARGMPKESLSQRSVPIDFGEWSRTQGNRPDGLDGYHRIAGDILSMDAPNAVPLQKVQGGPAT